jgi:hypothetical protein
MEEIKINTKKWFLGFCALHLFLWTVIPTFFFTNVYMDTAESIAWGYQWQLGYSKHPPLSGWIAATFANLGPFTGFQMYLLGSILALVTFWGIWRLASRILSPVKALISVLLLDCALYYNCYCATIDPDSVQIPFWALVFLTFYIALKEEKLYQWFLVGFCCALAFYAKYAAVLIFAPMGALILFTKEGRKQLFKPGMYLCFILFVLCLLPHLLWSYQHGFQEITYAYSASGVTEELKSTFLQSLLSSLNFIGAQLGFAALMYIMMLSFLFVKRDKTNCVGMFDKQFILIMGLGPLIIALLYPIILQNELMPRWGFPLFSLFGIIAMVWINPVITKKVFKRFLVMFLMIICIISGGYSIFYGYWAANVNGNYHQWSYFPGENIAKKVTNIWQERYHVPLKYIAGSHYLVAYITAYSKDHPIPYFDWEKSESEWMDINNMRKNGAVFVWWGDPSPQGDPGKKELEKVKNRFPTMEKLGEFRFDMVGIPRDNKPILKTFIKDNFPELLTVPSINQFFPNDPPYVDIWIAILPPERR